jgi:hypothetical protein
VSTSVGESRVEDILSDPAVSTWLKAALRESLERDPVDALNDVLLLASLLEDRLRDAFDLF